MITFRNLRRAGLILGLAAIAGCAVQDDEAPARVAVVMDETGSFQASLPVAAAIATRFIQENSLSGDAEVYLIAMDRSPRVLDFYPAEQFLDQRDSQMLKSLQHTNPLDGTDVVGALRCALGKLYKPSVAPPSKRYLLVFSDLHVDPATVRPGHKKSFPPLDAFEWSKLHGVETHFYFVAPDLEDQVTSLLQSHDLSAPVLDPAESRRVVLQAQIDGGSGS